MPETGTWTDPYPNYNFKIEIDGITEGHFAQCLNVGARLQVIPYREGGASQVVHRIPGPVEYADVTLRWGLTSSKELWLWFQNAVKGKVERKTVAIVVYASDGTTEKVRWNLINAWPKEFQCAPLDARGAEIAIYTLSLAFETLELAS
jgi:phage tail-like protein